MRYDKVVEIYSSETLSEELKNELLDRIAESASEEELIEESYSEVDEIVEKLFAIEEAELSEELKGEIVDKVFENLNEEMINEVSMAYLQKKAKNVLGQRKREAAQRSTSPIGLVGIKKAADAQKRAKEAEGIVTGSFRIRKAPKTSSSASTAKTQSSQAQTQVQPTSSAQPQQEPKEPALSAAQQRIQRNAEKTQATLDKTGSKEPIQVGSAPNVEDKTSSKKTNSKRKGNSASKSKAKTLAANIQAAENPESTAVARRVLARGRKKN